MPASEPELSTRTPEKEIVGMLMASVGRKPSMFAAGRFVVASALGAKNPMAAKEEMAARSTMPEIRARKRSFIASAAGRTAGVIVAHAPQNDRVVRGDRACIADIRPRGVAAASAPAGLVM